MKYRCTACDHVFDHKKDGEKPRCPKCMGIHDIEPANRPAPAKAEEKKIPVVPIVVILLLGGAVAAYFLYDGGDQEGDAVSPGDMEDRLVALGVPAEEVVVPFETSEAIEELAKAASKDEDGTKGMVNILDHLGKLRKDGAWAPDPQREARMTDPIGADDLARKLTAKGEKPYEASSYELAVLVLAMARSLDMDAHIAQIYSFQGEKAPADPGGKMGRFGVVLGKGSKEKKPPLFDPYDQRSGESAKGDYEVLSDEEAIAVHYEHQALARLMRNDTSAAHRKNDLAIKLAPGSSLHRIGRGLIFAASGAPTESLAEFEKAVKRRDDPVNRVNLADVLILTDPTGKKAEAEIQAALSKMPDYARARSSLGVIYYSRGEFDEAEAELAVAERLDPDSPEVMMAWAGFYVRKGLGEEAIEKAKRAVSISGETVSSLLALAGVYRATARFDEMRATLDKAIELSRSSSMATQIKRMFGYDPDAEEEEEEEVASIGGADAGLGDMELELNADKKSPFGGSLKLGEGGRQGLGGSGPGLGGSGPGLGGDGLKLDLNLQGN